MPLQAPEPKVSSGTPLSTAERYLERALDFYSRKKYDKALLDLNEAIRHESHNGELYATRGFIAALSGQPAEDDLSRALKLDPRQWLAHYTRGILAFQTGDYDVALQHFSLAQQIAPLRAEIYIYRAAAFFHKKDKAGALREIDSAQQVLQPDDDLNKEVRNWQSVIKKLK